MAAKGWGSISKRGNSWSLRWPLPPDPITGARRIGCETFKGTKTQARARLDKIHAELEDAPVCGTLADFWRNIYLPEAEGCLAPSTLKGYISQWEVNIAPTFGNRRMNEITGREVQAWIYTMSYGAARHAKAVLSAVFGRAHALDEVPDNVMARRYRLPGRDTVVSKPNEDVADPEKLGRMADAMRGEQWEAAYLASAFGGLRRSEAYGLKSDDVHAIETEGQVYAALDVQRGVQRIDGMVHVLPVKTERSERWAVVAPPWSARLLELAADGRKWMSGDGVGTPDPDRLTSAYRRWFTKSREAYIPFKNLRNSYATNMHTDGMELESVAKLLGHTTDAITYRHYDRPDVDDLVQRVADVVGDS